MSVDSSMTRDEFETALRDAVVWANHLMMPIAEKLDRYGLWRATRAVAEAGCYGRFAAEGMRCLRERTCPSCTATVKLDAMMIGADA